MATNRSVTVVPVAIREGQRRRGVELGPEFLLTTLGLPAQLAELGYSVTVDNSLGKHDAPALEALAAETRTDRSPASQTFAVSPAGKLHHVEYITAVCRRLAETAERNAAAAVAAMTTTTTTTESSSLSSSSLSPLTSNLVLTLGGDHSLGLGTVAGSVKASALCGRQVALIWVDAHADINTSETTFSGNVHGCPVAFLLGKTRGVGADLAWCAAPALRADQVVFIGLRDVEEGERRTLRELGIRCFGMQHVDELGIAEVVRRALAHVDPAGDRAIHLSFDIDSLDPAHAPATGTAVAGGLTLREGRYICEQVHRTNRLIAMDLVEVNPLLPHNEAADAVDAATPEATPEATRTGESAIAMILAALGKTLL